MQAVILCAGEGTRIRPLSASGPTPMVPVADRPLVAHTADAAAAAGATERVFVVGYHADVVSEYFGWEYAGVPVRYAVRERQDGTADAVRAAVPHRDGAFVVHRGAAVGLDARLRGATHVRPDPSVGHAVAEQTSVPTADACPTHLSCVDDSVLGRDVNGGAGTAVANRRHDDRPVDLTDRGRRVSTGRRKCGVVAGEGATTGIDTSLDPGVRLSVGATSHPGDRVARVR